MNTYVPINKGNYDMETEDRIALFEEYRGEGWEDKYKDYRNKWSEYPQKRIVSDWPLLVDIELSSICNLKCPMCYTITDEFKNRVHATLMADSLYYKIIDEIAGNVVAVRLSLRGEPTLHPNLIKYAKYAKQKGIYEVSFLTNGSKLTDEYITDLIESGVDWITISVDGIGNKYESIRKPLRFEETLNRIKRFYEIKKEKGVHRPVIKIQGIWPSIRDEAEEYYNSFCRYADQIAFNPLIDYLDNDENIVYTEGFSCPQLYQRIIVAADGKVLACSNDEDGLYVLGDMNAESLYSIWHGVKLTELRTIHNQADGFRKMEACKKCYLPRATEVNESVMINGRRIVIENYIGRSQVIGS